MKFMTIDAELEAADHPDNCTNPAIGSVVQDSSHNIQNTDASGETKAIASVDSASMNFPSHAHSYSVEDGCHDNQSHTLDPVEADLPNIYINGSKVYTNIDPLNTDPGSGGNITASSVGANNTINVQ